MFDIMRLLILRGVTFLPTDIASVAFLAVDATIAWARVHTYQSWREEISLPSTMRRLLENSATLRFLRSLYTLSHTPIGLALARELNMTFKPLLF